MEEEQNTKLSCNARLTNESIRSIAESVGIPVLLDKPCEYISHEVKYRMKLILQECEKFARHSGREKITVADFNNALILKNIPPQYGFSSKEQVPFRMASGGGREFHFQEEKELDLNDVINATPLKIPVDVSIKAHWLMIEGMQPAIAENPTPINKTMQQFHAGAASGATAADCEVDSKVDGNATSEKNIAPIEWMKMHKAKARVQLREISSHELSVEQQFYFKEITESCVGSDESKRTEALHSIASESGLYQMVPRFTTFISEGVRVNVVQHNLALLIYLMRMVKSLLDNSSLYLEKYLHELVPAVSTCLISRQLCVRPELDNHWALRDFASRLLSEICVAFNNSANNLQQRLTSILSEALANPRNSLSTYYGTIVGLSELGPSTIKTFVIPHIRIQGENVRCALEGLLTSSIDKVAAGHIRTSILKNIPPVVKSRQKCDNLENFVKEFGDYFGKDIFVAVCSLRSTSVTVPTAKPNQITQMRKSQLYINQQQQQQQHRNFAQSNQPTQKYVMVSQSNQQIYTNSQIITSHEHE